jgi:GNAT superfamily N-acetyltransferase
MIRKAHEDEYGEVMRVLESALLEVDPDEVREALGSGGVLVAVPNGHCRGVLLLDGRRIKAIAVTRTHRTKGIGSRLINQAVKRGSLTAEFRPEVRPFYESLDFEIECDGERCRGRLDTQESDTVGQRL